MTDRLDMSKYDGHTPGPWMWGGECGPHRIYGNIDNILATLDERWEYKRGSMEYDKNAELMAAAPALLAELRRCYAEMDKMENQIRRAIDRLDTHLGDTDPDYIDYYEQPDIHAMHILLGVEESEFE